jgi:hypothetical protein
METMQDRIQRTFENAREGIRHNFELDLSIVEQVALKECVRTCIENQDRCRNHDFNYSSPSVEAQSAFMTQYFGIPIGDESFFYFCENIGLDKVRKYLKVIQDRSHLI